MSNIYKINQQSTSLPNNISNYTINWANTGITNSAIFTVPGDGNKVILDEKASLEVKGKVVINGQDLEERLKIIENVLHILERDVKLEEKYPKLKKLYDEYMKELSKNRMWESLKGEE